MTRQTSARLAGFMFLFYIASGIPEMIVYGRASAGSGTAARLASISAHLTEMRWATALTMLLVANALVLGVALFAITSEVDLSLALLALTFRITEAATNTIPAIAKIGLLSIVTSSGPDQPSRQAIATLLLKIGGWTMPVGATSFAIGSALFCVLFLRGRLIPRALAWLGLAASALLVPILPLLGLRLLSGPIAQAVWIPMLVFEIAAGFWLLAKGVAPPVDQPAATPSDI